MVDMILRKEVTPTITATVKFNTEKVKTPKHIYTNGKLL